MLAGAAGRLMLSRLRTPGRIWRTGLGRTAALLAAVWVCHAPLLPAPFLADDEALALAAACRARQGRLLAYLGPRYWRDQHIATRGLYRPVREVVLGLVTRRWGLCPGIFHAVNLTLHSANVLLVYLLALRVLRRRAAAFAGALVFAVHPTHVEAVGFAKNFVELGAATLALSGLLAFLRAGAPGTSVARARLWRGAALVCFLLGLLTKEAACTLPALLVLAIVSTEADPGRRRRGLLGTAPFWAALAGYVVFYAATLLGGRLDAAPVAGPSGSQPLTALATLAFYARFVWFPVPLALTHPLSVAPWAFSPVALGQAGALGIAAWLLLYVARRWPRGRLFLLWAPVSIAPFANVVRTTARLVGEQRLYFPSVGVCVLMGCAFYAATRRSRRVLASVCAAVALVAFAGASLARSTDYRHKRAFAHADARRAPSDAAALCKLGKAYSDMGLRRQAVLTLESAAAGATGTRLRGLAYGELGTAYGRAGDHSRALVWLQRSVRLTPDAIGARESLGTALLRLGRPAEAIPHLRQAQGLDPTRPGPLVNLGQAYIDLGDLVAAQRLLEDALRQFPRDAVAHVAMAVLRSRLGDWPAAVRHLEHSAQLAPDRRATWERLAAAYRAVGRHADARRAMQQATKGSAADVLD